jgi:hypothetical protein
MQNQASLLVLPEEGLLSTNALEIAMAIDAVTSQSGLFLRYWSDDSKASKDVLKLERLSGTTPNPNNAHTLSESEIYELEIYGTKSTVHEIDWIQFADSF